MCYTLPKIWMGRIQKYWDKIVPSDYPVSGSSFKTTFTSDAAAVAVEKMENEINSDKCVALEAIPENTFVSNYVGTYDVEGTPGELTLLSPEKVTSDKVVALHFNEESSGWENIEDTQIIDGYVWGTLESFSPIAIFEYKNDIVITTDTIPGIVAEGTKVIANGNSISVYEDAEGKVFVVGPSSVAVELTAPVFVIGGSVDGTPIETTNVRVFGVTNSKAVSKVYAGSIFYDAENDKAVTTVGSANVSISGCKDIIMVTGSCGAVRTNNVNISVADSIVQTIACGQCFLADVKKDMNTANCSFASRAWVKNVNIKVSGSEVNLMFMGGNSGYLYVDNTVCAVENSKINYYTTGGSNGATKAAEAVVKNSTVNIFQSANRGTVGASVGKFINCEVENLYIGGDASDKTVDCSTNSIKVDISTGGRYNIVPGIQKKELISSNEIIESIKVTRNAKVTISDEFVAILGTKYVVK